MSLDYLFWCHAAVWRRRRRGRVVHFRNSLRPSNSKSSCFNFNFFFFHWLKSYLGFSRSANTNTAKSCRPNESQTLKNCVPHQHCSLLPRCIGPNKHLNRAPEWTPNTKLKSCDKHEVIRQNRQDISLPLFAPPPLKRS